MLGIPLATLSVLWAGAFLGALAAGGAGFAFALAASAIWLHALDPIQTTALIVACGSILHLTLVWPIRRSIDGVRLAPFLVGALVGVPLGVLVLTAVNPAPLKLALGLGMAAYALYALLAPRLPVIVAGGRWANAGIGFVGGILGGLGGYSGVVPTIWTQLRGWPKEVARGVYQPFILFAHVVTLAAVGVVGIDGRSWQLIILALPPLAIGAVLGLQIYGRLNEKAFKQMLSLMILISGLALVF
ncbi:sulfite exporter TauE/SafE family protein [Xanthobacter sp. YC-JY1]|uniref:sulfite exporter TauE/SafE family protein n=1 Tax=Xanthobacter sp. YC-JY1 TaxID=2419844 RepID=UPI001F3465EF|nr:sulfite exporter TauE/SafE family protein [Xanthobacter sp. YC-JY1]UJX44142.1 sulfite exporter TauE/SafE family protein [Xanthobacter sp. YC-JY1]